MAIQTRNSALAVKAEATEGTPVAPVASTDYTALQSDATMEAGQETIDNEELKASLGTAKSITGLQSPTFSFSHYLRASGTEGVSPDYNEILKAAFGSETVRATEDDTVAASTVTTIKVDTGEGVNYQRGDLLVIKDGANGYSLRPVHSVSGDDLLPGFDLSAAPGVGVNLGKNTLYAPTDADHQTLSVWHYIGNGGAVQMISGARVVDSSWSFAAGELINGSYSLEGIKYYFDPVEITASNDDMDFDDGGGEINVSVSQKMYTDPHELASAIESAMDASSSDTITCEYSDSTGKFTLTSDGATFELLYLTGTNTATTIASALGFTTADKTGALTYTSESAFSTLEAPQTPTFDSADPLVAKANEVFIGEHDDISCFAASTLDVTVATPKTDVLSICADTGRAGSIINSREVTVTLTALLSQYDADKFRRMRENTDTRFLYNFGEKTGGNWSAGKVGCLYIPTCTVTNVTVGDADGLATLDLELKAFVDDDGNGEVYLNFG